MKTNIIVICVILSSSILAVKGEKEVLKKRVSAGKTNRKLKKSCQLRKSAKGQVENVSREQRRKSVQQASERRAQVRPSRLDFSSLKADRNADELAELFERLLLEPSQREKIAKSPLEEEEL